jgi:hypothetical protein
MARGFESKDVEFQQAEASRPAIARKALAPHERDLETTRRSLELALARARAEREAAAHPNHRAMLDHAIQALNEQIERLG